MDENGDHRCWSPPNVGKSEKFTGFVTQSHMQFLCRCIIQGTQIHTKALRHMLQQMLHKCHVVVTWKWKEQAPKSLVSCRASPDNPMAVFSLNDCGDGTVSIAALSEQRAGNPVQDSRNFLISMPMLVLHVIVQMWWGGLQKLDQNRR